MAEQVDVQLLTMCLVQDGDKVLLLNRPSEKGFPGYIGPGGKVDFPESLTEGAAREVKEETGLHVQNLIYKGLDEYADPTNNVRYMVFNYLATSFEGQLIEDGPEGKPNGLRLMRQSIYRCSHGLKSVFRCFSKKARLKFTIYGTLKMILA